MCLPTVFSLQRECYPKVNINLDLVSKVRGTEKNSDFQFNYFKETDILWVDKLSVTNFGNCNITNLVINLNIRPQAGYKFKEKHPGNYDDMSVPFPDINANQTVILIREYFNNYHFILDNKTNNLTYGHWGYDLDEAGDWIVTYNIKDSMGNSVPHSSNLRINSQDIKWFKVITLLEASLVEYNSVTLRYNTQIVALTWALYFLTAVLVGLAIVQLFISKKVFKAQIKDLKDVKTYLKKILEKIPQRPTVKIKNKTKKIKK